LLSITYATILGGNTLVGSVVMCYSSISSLYEIRIDSHLCNGQDAFGNFTF